MSCPTARKIFFGGCVSISLFGIQAAAQTPPHWLIAKSTATSGPTTISTVRVDEKTKAVLTLVCKTGKHLTLSLTADGLNANDMRPTIELSGASLPDVFLPARMLTPAALYVDDASAASPIILTSRRIDVRIQKIELKFAFDIPDAKDIWPLITSTCPAS